MIALKYIYAVGSFVLVSSLMIRLVHCTRRVFKSILSQESWCVKGSKQGLDLSDLAKIEEEIEHPVELFRIWRDEARRYNPRAPDACCLATVSKSVHRRSIFVTFT